MIDSTLLQNSRLFDGFSSAECGQLAAAMESRRFGPGQAIVEEGHAPDHLYLVQSGAVRVTRSFGGSELTVATLHAGDHFGEMALIDEHPHSATVIADGACDIAQLSRTDLNRLLAGSDTMRAKYWQAIAVELTRRIRTTTNTVRDYVGINKALCENEKFREFYILCNSH